MKPAAILAVLCLCTERQGCIGTPCHECPVAQGEQEEAGFGVWASAMAAAMGTLSRLCRHLLRARDKCPDADQPGCL
jgi:hypothetical protein